MNDALRAALKAAGWKSGSYRGFLRASRAGIEFEAGSRPGDEERVLLRFRYRTETTRADGEEALSGDVTLARIEDAMTAIYLRVHERPDPTRFFGSGRRRAATTAARSTPAAPPPAPYAEPEAEGQTSLDF
jgi:hypothetical protein